MVDRLPIGLTGDPAFPVYHFYMPVQHQGNGFVNAGSVVWKDGFGFVGDLQDGFPEGDLRRSCRVLCEGVAFPIVGCYHCHYFNLPLWGLNLGACGVLLGGDDHAPVFF
jgi:hypothetical protein